MRLCCVPGCTNPHLARGMCRHHYMEEYHSRPEVRSARAAWYQRKASAVEFDEYAQELTPAQRLERVRVCYDRVCGVEGRLRWKRAVEYVEREVSCSQSG